MFEGRIGGLVSRTALAVGGIAIIALSSSVHAQEAAPTREQLWRKIEEQQRELNRLKRDLERTDKKVEATGSMLEETRKGDGSGTPGWWERTTLGGYGELHYNGGDKDEVDFHRFVLFLGHEFNDDIRLFTELEVEHALVEDTSDGSGPGEVELEQAFVEFDLDEANRAKAGLFLIPVGILNETHEPPTFFGTERNPVETNIIPTTWWEAGAGLSGELNKGFSYDVAVHSGLNVDTTGGGAFKVRGGRQKGAKADAKSGAATARLRWTAVPGVEVAATGQYQDDVTQDELGVSATLAEVHTDIRQGPWGLRALYARWDLNGSEAEAEGRDVQEGWYVEPSYRFTTRAGDIGFFARYNEWDNTAGDSTDSESRQVDFGVNYWPHPDVVLKADFQIQDLPGGKNEDNRINLGVGFQF